ncbi:bifunctional proline dehydrogenase/L-glutamate gamma-semialdehyde dehydrogenase PutA [Sphingomonas sp. ABOLD]|uniref:Bifunctional protein PutA n=2 Tax=Sphingomonas trueperi TaxID=53317 RepID=A0A7X5XX87_9SPHN|nr:MULTISPECIES: bifunctional proline dehydrogenase/L-glutamate gamma-semialdehyde dehydrogenase PutA [Sphingomonas]NJB96762.1 RHH-type proline utilization regulon transcriptional repressor/proline dehydrogenase/delta 1-pyrroline-5-carboxylate dehydrogenase [Sphingomonas trueperi]RSV51952.1 bifunctional proline dehydrogenase/L-glutamate gamma-semialdehyde dehydrogenase PutA [Sphingomonas sp. ABOLD]
MPTAVPSHHRESMAKLHRAAEPDVLKPLLERARLTPDSRERVMDHALALLADLRAAQNRGWVNQFLQEYRLNSSEGVALLSLAEAFLRVPDPETADLLIADKIGDADWKAHSGKSNSVLVNSATWGLMLGRALVGDEKTGVLRRLISRAGEPFVRQAVGAAMKRMGEVFVMGRTIDEAMKRMKKPENKGFTASFDMLGEAARTKADAERYFQAYFEAIRAVGRDPKAGHSISVKLSALHPRYEVAQYDRCVPELTDMLAQLASESAAQGIPLTVDAEESERLEMSLDIIGSVARRPELRGWNGFGMAVQAYGKRARAVIGWADDLGRPMHVRLVKGAYWDSEIKRTQVEGLADYPLFTRKAATDVSYLACARDMLAAKNIVPAFASHNALTVATILDWAGDSRDFEFQRLHGMGEGLYERLVNEQGYHCRIYAPVGGHRDLLAYLVRRLLENGANSSFVHQLADEQLSEAELLADPVEKIAAVGGTRHPSIPLPVDLFGAWKNSGGIDLAERTILAETAAAIAASPPPARGRGPGGGPTLTTSEPAVEAGGPPPAPSRTREGVASAIDRASAAFPGWAATPLATRAAILERLADLLEENRIELMALAVKEAFKTIPDALGEVREAADFCRYYALQARTGLAPITLPGPTGERNELRMEGRGVWATIAPWNFPLAIFLGQTAAALVAGNAVVAKPAPQTPEIARAAVRLAHQAGVPEDALVLVTGGPEVGAALTSDHRIAGVAFTGSTPTAKKIAAALLEGNDRPLVPLIAETGGINAMIVDSTALPEQVVADVLTSAFRSAGQRCSALRLLLLQEEIAEGVIEMLRGAMELLILGDPADPRTDIGPVIDQAAYDKLMAYRDSAKAQWIKTVPVPATGLFVPPTMIRIDRPEDLTREWFGPILHVATWKAGTLAETVARVNAKGFGLTMGLHSRIARSAELVEAEARVGNLYINRSMIGAVVGSQPFGGEGLSGTGPKAGGPHYLHRFCAERAVSVDTTSAGGNATLLSLDEGGI